MTRTSTIPARAAPTRIERAVVPGGFVLAVFATAWSIASDAGIEAVAAAWLAAAAWAFLSSLALALRRGLRHRDWRAFGRCGMTDGTEPADWDTQTGEYAWLAVAEEHERLMRGD